MQVKKFFFFYMLALHHKFSFRTLQIHTSNDSIINDLKDILEPSAYGELNATNDQLMSFPSLTAVRYCSRVVPVLQVLCYQCWHSSQISPSWRTLTGFWHRIHQYPMFMSMIIGYSLMKNHPNPTSLYWPPKPAEH